MDMHVCKVSIILLALTKNLNALTNFSKMPQYKI